MKNRPGKSHATWTLGWLRTRVFISWARYPRKKTRVVSCPTYTHHFQPTRLLLRSLRGERSTLSPSRALWQDRSRLLFTAQVLSGQANWWEVLNGPLISSKGHVLKFILYQKAHQPTNANSWRAETAKGMLIPLQPLHGVCLNLTVSNVTSLMLKNLRCELCICIFSMIIWSKSSQNIYRVPGRATFFMFLELKVKSFSGPCWVQWTKVHDTTNFGTGTFRSRDFPQGKKLPGLPMTTGL